MADGSGLKAGPIKGAKEARKVLVELPDQVRHDLPAESGGVAASVAADVQAAFPSLITFAVPTSIPGRLDMAEVAVDANASTSDSDAPVGSVSGDGEQVPMFRVIVQGEGVVYADFGNTAVNDSGARYYGVNYLNRTAGSPSRFAWPVAERAKSRVEALLRRRAERYMEDLTADLAEPSE